MATAAAVLFLLFSGVAFSEGATQKQPRVSIVPDKIDFGTIDEGSSISMTFTIKNAGTADLIIYDAKPSCGCTVAKLSNKEVAPGKEATLETVYSSHVNGTGPINKAIIVSTNDPVEPTVVLNISGNVKAVPGPEITLSMYSAANIQIPAGGTEKRSLTITNAGQTDLTVSDISTTPGISINVGDLYAGPGRSTRLELVLKPGESKVIEVTIAPKAASGIFQEVLSITSNSKKMPNTLFIAGGVIQG